MSGPSRVDVPELKVGEWLKAARGPLQIHRILRKGGIGVVYEAIREDERQPNRHERGSP